MTTRHKRSKSTPAPKTAERRKSRDFLEELDENLTDLADHVTQPKSRRKKHIVRKSTLDNRPPWNNDTHIDGYDDVDEKGKIRKREPVSQENRNRAKLEQEALTKQWMESLRA